MIAKIFKGNPWDISINCLKLMVESTNIGNLYKVKIIIEELENE